MAWERKFFGYSVTRKKYACLKVAGCSVARLRLRVIKMDGDFMKALIGIMPEDKAGIYP